MLSNHFQRTNYRSYYVIPWYCNAFLICSTNYQDIVFFLFNFPVIQRSTALFVQQYLSDVTVSCTFMLLETSALSKAIHHRLFVTVKEAR